MSQSHDDSGRRATGDSSQADGSPTRSKREAMTAGRDSGSQPPRRGNQPPYSSGDVPPRRNNRGHRTLILALTAILLLIVAITSAGIAYSSFNQGRTGQGTRGAFAAGSTTTPTFTATSTAIPAVTATTTNTGKTTNTPPPVAVTPTIPPTVTPTTQPVAFSVTGVNATVDHSNYHGACASTMLFTFTGIINVPAGSPGGTVSYTWLRSDSATGPTETVSFNAGVTSQTVTTTWQLGSSLGNGTTFWEALQVTAPNSVTSAHANFSFVCQNQNQNSVTSISASVSPSAYDCSQSVITFNFSATIAISPGSSGMNITYTWARSDGATMSPITLSVPAGQTTVSVTDTWTLGVGAPTGSYWEQVVVTSPNHITSNQATFSKPC